MSALFSWHRETAKLFYKVDALIRTTGLPLKTVKVNTPVPFTSQPTLTCMTEKQAVHAHTAQCTTASLQRNYILFHSEAPEIAACIGDLRAPPL